MSTGKQPSQVILYDLRKHTYPHQRGDEFRSQQIAECPVCNALTNNVIMGGSPGYGVRMVCPNACADWHHLLEDKQKLLAQPHPQSYRDELKREIDTLHAAHRGEQVNDLDGPVDLNDPSLRQCVTNTRGYAPIAATKTLRETIDDLRGRD